MSGGVALNGAMVAALRDALRRPVRVLPEPQLIGALGAALSVCREGDPRGGRQDVADLLGFASLGRTTTLKMRRTPGL